MVTTGERVNRNWVNGEAQPVGSRRLKHNDIVGLGGPRRVILPKKANESVKNPFVFVYECPISQDAKDLGICSVCFGHLCRPMSVSGCGHTFCELCIRKWWERKLENRERPTCPTCREVPSLQLSKALVPNLYAQRHVDSLLRPEEYVRQVGRRLAEDDQVKNLKKKLEDRDLALEDAAIKRVARYFLDQN